MVGGVEAVRETVTCHLLSTQVRSRRPSMTMRRRVTSVGITCHVAKADPDLRRARHQIPGRARYP